RRPTNLSPPGAELGRAGGPGRGHGFCCKWGRLWRSSDTAADRMDHGDTRLARGLLPCWRSRHFSRSLMLLVCHRSACRSSLGQCRRTPTHHSRGSDHHCTGPSPWSHSLEGSLRPGRSLVPDSFLFCAGLYHLHLLFLVLAVFGERPRFLGAQWGLV